MGRLKEEGEETGLDSRSPQKQEDTNNKVNRTKDTDRAGAGDVRREGPQFPPRLDKSLAGNHRAAELS